MVILNGRSFNNTMMVFCWVLQVQIKEWGIYSLYVQNMDLYITYFTYMFSNCYFVFDINVIGWRLCTLGLFFLRFSNNYYYEIWKKKTTSTFKTCGVSIIVFIANLSCTLLFCILFRQWNFVMNGSPFLYSAIFVGVGDRIMNLFTQDNWNNKMDIINKIYYNSQIGEKISLK